MRFTLRDPQYFCQWRINCQRPAMRLYLILRSCMFPDDWAYEKLLRMEVR